MAQHCPVTEEQINALVDGELSGKQQQRVAAHVSHCSRCSRLAGELLAGKSFVGARMPEVDPPANSWERIRAGLDRVDGTIDSLQQPRERRQFGLVPILAACGLLLIIGAVIWRHHYLASNSVAAKFVRQHMAAVSTVLQLPAEAGTVYDVVSARQGPPRWVPVARWLLRTQGGVADQTLYKLDDRSPVSEFIVPGDLDMAEFSSVGFQGRQYWISVQPKASVVAWKQSGITHILVGRTDPEGLIEASASRRSRPAMGPNL